MSHHRVVISGTFYNQAFNNVIYLENPDGLLSDQEIAGNVLEHFIQHTKAGLPQDVFYKLISVRDADNSNSAPTLFPISTQGNQAADTELCPFACWVLLWKTARAGRHGRGRIYLPGVLKGFHFLGNLKPEGELFWQAAIGALKGAWINPATTGLFLKLKNRGVANEYTAVTDMFMRGTMGAQRRRNIGVGA